MKKTLLITVGIIFLILLVGVWAYLFFVGTPESVDDIFSDLSFGDSAAPITPTEGNEGDLPAEGTTTTPTTNPLSQLTTVPVAGFTFLQTSTSSPVSEIMYAEQGTGHVYHYELTSQNRTRVSNTTVPATQTAYIDSSGLYAVLETPEKLQIVTFDNVASSSDVTLSGSHQNLTLTETNELYYTQTDTSGTTAYSYDIDTGITTTLFDTPLQDIRVLWGTDTHNHHFYNTTAETLPGYLYQVTQGEVRRTPISGTSLTVLAGPEKDSFIYTTQNASAGPTSTWYQSDQKKRLSGFLYPNKCTTNTTDIWCAFDITDSTNVTEWYRGEHSFTDNLWKINRGNGTSQLVVSFRTEGGRVIDVVNLQVNTQGDNFLFANKRNGYLWTYNLTQNDN